MKNLITLVFLSSICFICIGCVQNWSKSSLHDLGSDSLIQVNGYSCYKTDKDICEIEAAIFKATNEFRKSKGLQEFQANVSLSYVARDWSQQQAQSGSISHNGFPESRNTVLEGLKSNTNLDASKINSLSRENVASNVTGGSNEAIGKAFVDMWLNSSGHLDNILASSTYLGVGVSNGNGGNSFGGSNTHNDNGYSDGIDSSNIGNGSGSGYYSTYNNYNNSGYGNYSNYSNYDNYGDYNNYGNYTTSTGSNTSSSNSSYGGYFATQIFAQ